MPKNLPAPRDAGVPFPAVVPPGEHRYRERATRFRELGAVALLTRAKDFDKLLFVS